MLGAVRAGVMAETDARAAVPPPPLPFVTISREAGAGGRTLAYKLAALLDRLDPPPAGQPRWAVWDHELVEKVAAEAGIDAGVVEKLEVVRRPWLAELLSGLSAGGDPAHPDELQVYRRVAAAIRGLARAGRAIVVGRGGAYVTRDLPGGVHVRLIAPRAARVRHMAGLHQVPDAEAAKMVDHIDRSRAAFLRSYWPVAASTPEAFSATFNTAAVPDDRVVAAIAELVRPEVVEAAADETLIGAGV
ncbi:MAG TPA: cytidylate kinase-like family protein [Humisphaera sp.]